MAVKGQGEARKGSGKAREKAVHAQGKGSGKAVVGRYRKLRRSVGVQLLSPGRRPKRELHRRGHGLCAIRGAGLAYSCCLGFSVQVPAASCELAPAQCCLRRECERGEERRRGERNGR